MKFLKKYNQFNEAISISQYRPFDIEFNRTRYEDLFTKMKEKYSGDKNAYRIYIPLTGVKENPIKIEIENFLKENGFDLVDYVAGICKRPAAKNTSKIGQVLTRAKKDDLMKKFVSDPSRKSGDFSDLIVCISRHPYDIAGADTDRNWTNCMTMATPDSKRVLDLEEDLRDLESDLKKAEMESYLGDKVDRKITEIKSKIADTKLKIQGYKEEGSNAYKLVKDVKYGSLISFLIKKDDLNIKNPIANLNIKPYQNKRDKKDIILVSDTRMYGQGMSEFKETVDKWLQEVNGDRTQGLYCIKDGLYIDSHTPEYRILKVPNSTEELDEMLKDLEIDNYEIKDNLVVDVQGDVNLADKGIVEIPFKFGRIDGNFNISVNRLETLKNMPDYVGGDFNCSNNVLKSLEGCPQYIGGDLHATKNNIKSTKGIGDVVGSIDIDTSVKNESIDVEKETYDVVVLTNITNIPNQNQDIKSGKFRITKDTMKEAKKLKDLLTIKGHIDGYKIIDVWIE